MATSQANLPGAHVLGLGLPSGFTKGLRRVWGGGQPGPGHQPLGVLASGASWGQEKCNKS